MSSNDTAAAAGRERFDRVVAALTEAGRADVDVADFLAHASAAAAANLGGIEALLAGRSGSWEADLVRQLVAGTVGWDGEYLWEYRTEPIVVRVQVAEILADLGIGGMYDQAVDELDRRREAAEQAEDAAEESASADLLWHYDRTAEGTWVPREPAAPAWSWEAFRAARLAEGVSTEVIDRWQESMRAGVGFFSGQPEPDMWTAVPRSPEAAAELRRLDAERTARMSVYDRLDKRLEQQREGDWAAYGQAFAEQVRRAAGELFPTLSVPVDVAVTTDWQTTNDAETGYGVGPEWQLWETAHGRTPLPGSGIPFEDYPSGADLAQTETDAGRDPLTRLMASDASTDSQEESS